MKSLINVRRVGTDLLCIIFINKFHLLREGGVNNQPSIIQKYKFIFILHSVSLHGMPNNSDPVVCLGRCREAEIAIDENRMQGQINRNVWQTRIKLIDPAIVSGSKVSNNLASLLVR